ncbi:MAG: hypothetical protein ACKPKO_12445, partial [Candidatus Fonsibacter sp.]
MYLTTVSSLLFAVGGSAAAAAAAGAAVGGGAAANAACSASSSSKAYLCFFARVVGTEQLFDQLPNRAVQVLHHGTVKIDLVLDNDVPWKEVVSIACLGCCCCCCCTALWLDKDRQIHGVRVNNGSPCSAAAAAQTAAVPSKLNCLVKATDTHSVSAPILFDHLSVPNTLGSVLEIVYPPSSGIS